MVDCFVKDGEGAAAVPVTAVAPDDLDRLKAELPEASAAWVATTGFAAGAGDVCLLPAADGSLARVLFGLGAGVAEPNLGPGRLPTALPPGDYRLDATFDDPGLAAVAWALGAYRFDRYRQNGGGARRLVVDDALAAEVAPVVGGVRLARDLINTPANDLGPAELAAAARTLAEKHDAVYAEVVGEGLVVENFPLVHAVGAAASGHAPPRTASGATRSASGRSSGSEGGRGSTGRTTGPRQGSRTRMEADFSQLFS